MDNHDYLKTLSSSILSLRKQYNLTQEALAEKLGVTFQAVSKWENGLSYPEIALLPEIADIFSIGIDTLFGHLPDEIPEESAAEPETNGVTIADVPWDDDDKLRGVVYRGRTLLADFKDLSEFTFNITGPALNVESYCNLTCGEILGNAAAGGSITCGDADAAYAIRGDAAAGNSITCGDVDGDAKAGNSIACGNVDGDVNAGYSAACGNVDGDVRTGSQVRCGNVDGDVTAGGDLFCGDVGGDVMNCGGSLHCADIGGDVKCQGDIDCLGVSGDVHCKGGVTYKA